jgi:tRNA(Glu) U13 pseudouridine synthase TruD
MEPASRSLRLRVSDLAWQIEKDVVWLEFKLAKGGYATVVLGEIASF